MAVIERACSLPSPGTGRTGVSAWARPEHSDYASSETPAGAVRRRRARSEGNPTTSVCNRQPRAREPSTPGHAAGRDRLGGMDHRGRRQQGLEHLAGRQAPSPLISLALTYAGLNSASLVKITIPPSSSRNQNNEGRTTPDRLARLVSCAGSIEPAGGRQSDRRRNRTGRRCAGRQLPTGGVDLRAPGDPDGGVDPAAVRRSRKSRTRAGDEPTTG